MPEPGELYNGTNTGNNIDSSSPVNSLTQSANKLAQSVDQLTKVLQGTKKDFDGLSKSRSKAEKDNTSDMSKMFEQANRDGEKRLSTAQKVGQSLIKSAQVVFNYTLNQFKRGFSSIVDNFNANFTTITSRMQKSNQEYASMLLESTKWIKDNDLRTQFSQIDWSNALVPVLESGIRGGLAEDMAYRNMISNRLLPMLSTNTREYTRMSKLFGKTFTDGIAAIGTYSERILQSAEGLEENNLNDIITTAYREVQEQVRREGGSAADVTSRMTEIIGSYQTAAKAYGAQTAMEMLQGYVSGISGAAEMSGSNLLGTITGARSFNQYITGMENLVSGYMSGSGMKSAYAAQGFGPLGVSQTLVDDILNNMAFGEGRADADKLMADFSASAETQQNMYKLQEGYYQSITEQQDNFNENLMAKIGTWSAEYIPHTMETLSAIYSLLKQLAGIWLGGSLLKGIAGGGGLGGGFLDAGLTGGGARWNSLLGGSPLGAKLGGAISTVAPLAGLALMGKDAIAGFQKGGIGGAIEGALAGNTSATSGWGIAKNALGNTAKGAMIGAKFGPWGAAIGAGVGLIGNLAMTAVHYSENLNKKYQEDFAKNLKAFTESLNDTTKAIKKSHEAYLEQISLVEEYRTNQEKLDSSTSGLDATQRKLLELQQEELALKIKQKAAEIGSVEEAQRNYRLLESQEAEVNAKLDIIAKGQERKEQIGALNLESKKVANLTYDEMARTLGFSSTTDADEFVKSYIASDTKTAEQYKKTLEKHGAVAARDWALRGYLAHAYQGLGFSPDMNIKGKGDLDEWGTDLESAFGKVSEYTDLASKVKETKSGMITGLGDVLGTLRAATREDAEEFGLYRGLQTEFYNYITSLDLDNRSILGASVGEYLTAQGIPQELAQGYEDYLGSVKTYDANNPPWFKSGALNILRNGLHAVLHAGEMVLPTPVASALRSLSGASSMADVADYVSKAKPASALPDTELLDGLSSAIETQTNILSEILSSILDRVVNIDAMLDGQTRRDQNRTGIPRSVITWDGVPV